MRFAVVGSNGRTGRLVVEQALARGHEVLALARRPVAPPADMAGMTSVGVDILDRDALVEAMRGADAVISAVGIGTSRQPSRVYSAGAANLLHAMGRQGVPRLVVVSAVPVGPRAAHSFVERRLVLPILERAFGATYQDMRRMEAVLRASAAAWTVLRPPRLVDRPPTGRYRLSVDGPLPRAGTIRLGDLAAALLDVVGRDDLYGRAAYVAN